MRLLPRFLAILLVTIIGLPLQACAFTLPPAYSAEAMEAWVVDEDTGQPLAGVIVTANWQLYGGYHRSHVGQMMVMETETDAKGRFSFPPWGPKLRLAGGYLDYDDPQILLFMSGYEFRGLENRLREKVNRSSIRRSDWNGQTIKMKKFAGNLKEYARHLGFLTTSLGFIRHGKECEWKHIPHLLLALDRQGKLFKERGVSPDLPSIDHLRDQDKCGSAWEYLRSYLP